MKESLNTLEMIEAFAESVSAKMAEDLPSQLLASMMTENNCILRAAIIENGGELLVSSHSVYEMMKNTRHIAAIANDDGSIKLTLTSKDEILRPESELVPL